MTKPRILYLTGWTRSGTTLLGNVLGELPGVLHVGELHYLWRNGVLGTGTNSICGCGKRVTQCPLWLDVLAASGVGTPVEATQMVRQQRAHLRTRHLRARLAEATGTAAPVAAAVAAVNRSAAIYRLLSERGGDRLIVDGSKYPAEAAALLGRTDLDVHVLHMVRDPRATAFSYKRAKAYIAPMHPARSSGFWTAFNLASELVGRAAGERYLRIRHEDLCARPREIVGQVMRFAGLGDEPPVDKLGRVSLGRNHTVTGNPDRLGSGDTVIRADERWRKGLSVPEVAAATAFALPALTRYGYPALAAR